ncbi:TetR/AcrR family transcriptional regulator [Pseudonocardia benzenivorans]|jgi:AcrR family transcriptional regulator|uniref:Regulatory protein TetR n=2 Tax=Pseudonocardia TaxID=1847 RepID=F4CTL7_PSEUX|nr:TetR/AcrR family transcriptional regulator [Pseudonocardia dioxanivorans]AEA28520.1 regulatory protein TetR [Pseudonocardia dioxanivorans CB1190]GJF01986.1 TetR family transcriptional regulator [Pseudonocardia sp. D17]
MPRSGADARRRLREAALDLYREHGYDATTTAQIAERAGVTERTYFRHFADKREVLFDGEDDLRTVLVDAVAAAPPELPPLAVLTRAFTAAVPLFVAGRSVAERRQEIIVATPALQERAHAKSAALTEALATALAARGLPRPSALLAGRIGMASFGHALGSWDGRSASELERLIAESAAEARSLG